MKTIAIITARGGSKRIPQKNVKDFLGKPIIAYSIEAAINSNKFDEVMVSTDSEEIAAVAKQYGAKVPFLRSEKTSDDYATTSDVIKEVLIEYRKNGRNFDVFMCIYPTAPFVTDRTIIKAFELFNNKCVIPVVKYSYPPQRAFLISDGFVKYQYQEYSKIRSQDLEPIYHDCGQFYLCNTNVFFEENTVVLDGAIPLIINESEVQDIDTLEDWSIAEMKYKLLHR